MFPFLSLQGNGKVMCFNFKCMLRETRLLSYFNFVLIFVIRCYGKPGFFKMSYILVHKSKKLCLKTYTWVIGVSLAVLLRTAAWRRVSVCESECKWAENHDTQEKRRNAAITLFWSTTETGLFSKQEGRWWSLTICKGFCCGSTVLLTKPKTPITSFTFLPVQRIAAS